MDAATIAGLHPLRDFDEVLFQHFVGKFKVEENVECKSEAPLNIECLMDEKDVRGFIKRDEFEDISIPIRACEGSFGEGYRRSLVDMENIHSIEVVGSGSRVPAIIRILTEFFGKELRRTMNASECVAGLRDGVSWNLLVSGYCQMGFHGKAREVFHDSRVADVTLDKFSYASVLGVCAQMRDVKLGEIVHGLIFVSGLSVHEFLVKSLIDMYSKCGKVDNARRVFES
ncbi:hypothetical protein IFM89_012061 [Coptis chinensis]|uniref:Pentatricopeptide repeat-containing protein n=1 Tax=Coptis chinensis TaxID=261450 RepID=A0A835I4B4_9MAGN|nr:hypothetical protein IFM89_012061 [Coptis chinensis]